MSLRDFDAAVELESQRELFGECFPEHRSGELSSELHYRWKFESSPLGKRSEQFVASEDERLLGYYAAIPFRYSCGSDRYTAAMVCDVMTSPAARGRGVFTTLGRHATKELASREYDFTTGFPIRKEVIPGHLKVGWKPLFQLPLHVRILDSGALLASKGWPLTGRLVSGVQGIGRALTGGGASLPSGYSARNGKASDAGCLEDLSALTAATTDVPIALEKSKAFLQWRLGAPGTEYDVHFLRYDGRDVGYAITRAVPKFGVRALAVLDLYVSADHRHAAGRFLSLLATFGREHGAAVLATMAGSHQAKQYRFWRAGLVPTHLRYTFIVKELNRLPEGAADGRRWQLMWIDSDIF